MVLIRWSWRNLVFGCILLTALINLTNITELRFRSSFLAPQQGHDVVHDDKRNASITDAAP
eukprot:2773848-Ditylum_brightwellii.AAC.1